MECPACHHENPASAKVCSQCGSDLAPVCGSCRAELPAEARFCHACGTPVRGGDFPRAAERDAPGPTAASAAEATSATSAGEYRQLTVMFCDLVDSTRLASTLGAEAWRDVVRSFQAHAARALERFEGHVAQYLGDGLLVYFGYPRAHENDAERAVHAGLGLLDVLDALNPELERQHGVALAARVGVHTGRVVVSAMGGGERHEPLAVGEAVNLASRLKGASDAGTLVISEATRRLVQGIFALKDLGPQTLKGFEEPVLAYRVLGATGVRSRLELAAASGLTPLVGRDRELGLVLDRWSQAKQGRGQALLIRGDPGMGKSRLVHELHLRLADEPHTWLECHGSPYYRNSALRPIAELLQRRAQIEPDDPADLKLTRLERAFQPLGAEFAQAIPLFASLLEVPLPDGYPRPALSLEAQRRRMLEAVAASTLAMAEQQPVVGVVEDLHWVDPSTLELLGMLARKAPSARLFLLMTARSEFEGTQLERAHAAVLPLRTLTGKQTGTMVEAMTGGRRWPSAVLEQVSAKTDGVPLFVEELTKAVLESGLVRETDRGYERGDPLPELAIPSTLQDSLLARLDRLGPARELAQLAAVLGREFSFELLEAIGERDEASLRRDLGSLVAAELLYQRGAPPDASYTFKHALIQDTAHQLLVKTERQRHHARVVEALESRFPERVESEPELLARHCEEANLVEKAIAYHRRAGERAMWRSANREAIDHLTRAVDLLPTLGSTRERARWELALHCALGPPLLAAQGYADPEVERVYQRMRALSREVGDAPLLAEAVYGLSQFHMGRAELEAAAGLASQFLELAEAAGDRSAVLAAFASLAALGFLRGELPEALECLERARAFDDGASAPTATPSLSSIQDPGIDCRAWGSLALWTAGYPERALRTSREMVSLAREGAHSFSLAEALDFSALVHQMRGERDEARVCADEAIALAEEQELADWLGIGKVLRGWARADSTDAVAGLEELHAGLAQLGTSRTEAGAPYFLALLADANRTLGRDDDARGAIALALDLSRKQRSPFWDPELYRMRAELLLRQGERGRDEAEAELRRACELAARLGARSLELRAAASLARLWRQQGRREAARELLAPVCDWFGEGFDTPELRGAKALLAELS